MPRMTKPVHPRILIIFDFDETLAIKTDHILCAYLGTDYKTFNRQYIAPLIEQGFEHVLAKAWAYIHYSQNLGNHGNQSNKRIGRDTFTTLAKNYPLFKGVEEIFGHLRNVAAQIDPDIEVEFHMVTAGFVAIPQKTSIAPHFKAIWGGHYHYDDNGHICFVKNIIGHPEKVRYVQMIAKGLSETGANGPEDIHKPIADEDWHAPLEQIIYVGDGNSDMQTFGFLKRNRGIALGVYRADQAEDWHAKDDVFKGREVENLLYADYSEGSPLYNALTLSVKSIGYRIALRGIAAE